jgi:hypothetical protein
MPTTRECQSTLLRIGIKIGVSPSLISTRLLSKDDKQDMLNGLLPEETLFTAVKCWIDADMPNYAEGEIRSYKIF